MRTTDSVSFYPPMKCAGLTAPYPSLGCFENITFCLQHDDPSRKARNRLSTSRKKEHPCQGSIFFFSYRYSPAHRASRNVLNGRTVRKVSLSSLSSNIMTNDDNDVKRYIGSGVHPVGNTRG